VTTMELTAEECMTRDIAGLVGELLTLLDMIDAETIDSDIQAIACQRFAICDKYGLRLEMSLSLAAGPVN